MGKFPLLTQLNLNRARSAKVPLLIFSLLCGIYMNMSIKQAFADTSPKVKVNQATGNYTHHLTNRVNYPIVYILPAYITLIHLKTINYIHKGKTT